MARAVYILVALALTAGCQTDALLLLQLDQPPELQRAEVSLIEDATCSGTPFGGTATLQTVSFGEDVFPASAELGVYIAPVHQGTPVRIEVSATIAGGETRSGCVCNDLPRGGTTLALQGPALNRGEPDRCERGGIGGGDSDPAFGDGLGGDPSIGGDVATGDSAGGDAMIAGDTLRGDTGGDSAVCLALDTTAWTRAVVYYGQSVGSAPDCGSPTAPSLAVQVLTSDTTCGAGDWLPARPLPCGADCPSGADAVEALSVAPPTASGRLLVATQTNVAGAGSQLRMLTYNVLLDAGGPLANPESRTLITASPVGNKFPYMMGAVRLSGDVQVVAASTCASPSTDCATRLFVLGPANGASLTAHIAFNERLRWLRVRAAGDRVLVVGIDDNNRFGGATCTFIGLTPSCDPLELFSSPSENAVQYSNGPTVDAAYIGTSGIVSYYSWSDGGTPTLAISQYLANGDLDGVGGRIAFGSQVRTVVAMRAPTGRVAMIAGTMANELWVEVESENPGGAFPNTVCFSQVSFDGIQNTASQRLALAPRGNLWSSVHADDQGRKATTLVDESNDCVDSGGTLGAAGSTDRVLAFDLVGGDPWLIVEKLEEGITQANLLLDDGTVSACGLTWDIDPLTTQPVARTIALQAVAR